MKIKIFVSYCHQDIKPDDARLKILVDHLGMSGRGTFDILVDYRHPEAAVGASLSKFMQLIDNADAVLILLTPGYKQRVTEKGGSGVYYEFRRIYDRLLKSEEQNTYGRTFLLIPIIFSGTFEQACPHEINRLICRDVTWLFVVPGRHPARVRKDVGLKLRDLIKDITDRISAITTTRAQLYLENQEKLFRHFLFQDTKSRWDKPENYKYLDSVFIKTATFIKARDKEVNFLIGRKGSGKSTITHVLPILSTPRPSIVLRIEFEDLPFSMCFNVLRSRPRDASDLRNAFSPLYSYQLLWDVFLHLFYAWSIRDLIPRRTKLRRLLDRAFQGVDLSATGEAELSIVTTQVLFVFAFQELANYLSKAMGIQGINGGLSGAVAQFSPTAFRKHVFGDRPWKHLQTFLRAHKNAGESILVTADGFDVMVGYFPEAANDKVEAKLFETELLLALFQIVLNKGPMRVVGGILYEVSDCCIAIPHDRFTEVRGKDHDRYQYRHRFSKIVWSGIELSALVRKRLALLRKVHDPKGRPLEDRLATVMAKGFPELPDEVTFRFGNANYRMPLFLYVLRHTFWRPRDILFYYAALLAASDDFQKRGKEMPAGFVRQVIAGATRVVVVDEFLDELKLFDNLRVVLGRFRQAPQVLSWGELDLRIGDIVFDIATPEDEGASLEWKVEILFDLGVLGVFLDKETATHFSAFRHAFSFNEEHFLTRNLDRDDYREYNFILHPVLCEYLHLDTSKNSELILPLDWDYLHRNEVLRGIVPP
ncbi:MAG: hypothetical protein GY835_24960 [bacterium]|nr:hypothetical protein [bacterium]